MVTEKVTVESWGDRIKSSLAGFVGGPVLILIAFITLFWNEGRAVQTAKSLGEGKGAVVAVSSDKVDSANDKKLIHFSGPATTSATLSDPEFGVSAPAIRLQRDVQMYQWKENQKKKTKKKAGGKKVTTTTYTYEKAWASSLYDSSKFEESKEHPNPGRIPYKGLKKDASDVKVNAFKLSPTLVQRMTSWEDLAVKKDVLEKLPKNMQRRATVDDGGIYLSAQPGGSPNKPQIGDVRIKFQIVKPGDVSIVGQQVGSSLTGYKTKAGDTLLMLNKGKVGADAMFAKAEAGNATMTWILRFVGFLMFLFGFNLLFKPLAVLGDVIPIIGSIIGGAGFIVALALSSGLSLVTIAVAWLFYRPLVAIPLLIVGIGVPVFLIMKKKKAAAGDSEAPAAA